MRVVSWFMTFLMSATVYSADDRVNPIKAETYMSYPTFENGSNVQLRDRSLQSLKPGSTFQLSKHGSDNLGFLTGVYTEEGLVEGRLTDGTPNCFVAARPEPPGRNQLEDDVNRNLCVLRNIRGFQVVKREEKKTSYLTQLELSCRGGALLAISCHQPNDGDAKEMTMGRFEKILSKKLAFGELKLETPLMNMVPNGSPAENPVTPAQILSGHLRFEFRDTSSMGFNHNEGTKNDFYKIYLQNGIASSEIPKGKQGYLNLSVSTPNGDQLTVAPNPTDISNFLISSVEVGYSKYGGNSERRDSMLLVRGTKKINGTDANIVLYWTDPVNSHVTYESMWRLPGRKTIDNWYQN